MDSVTVEHPIERPVMRMIVDLGSRLRRFDQAVDDELVIRDLRKKADSPRARRLASNRANSSTVL